MPDRLPVQSVTEVIDPFTGSLVDVSDPQVAAEFLDALRGSKETITKLVHAVEEMLATEFERQGTRTINAGGWELEQRESVSFEWDEQELQKLLDAGLPEERYMEFINQTVSIRPKQNIAKQLETNPAYAVIIEQARTRIVKGVRVDVRRAKGAIEP
jgi:hypothetical protein